MFLIKKKLAKLFLQISGPHSTCEEVVMSTVDMIKIVLEYDFNQR